MGVVRLWDDGGVAAVLGGVDAVLGGVGAVLGGVGAVLSRGAMALLRWRRSDVMRRKASGVAGNGDGGAVRCCSSCGCYGWAKEKGRERNESAGIERTSAGDDKVRSGPTQPRCGSTWPGCLD